ncbi:2003_t:CDS:1, partial [Funneliformis caledonium]
KEKLPSQKRQDTTQTTEQEAVTESFNIAQPPIITMEVNKTSDTTPLPLDKEKTKETDTVTKTITNNKKDEMNVNGPFDVSENTINTTLVAFAMPLLSAEKFFAYFPLEKYPRANFQ